MLHYTLINITIDWSRIFSVCKVREYIFCIVYINALLYKVRLDATHTTSPRCTPLNTTVCHFLPQNHSAPNRTPQHPTVRHFTPLLVTSCHCTPQNPTAPYCSPLHTTACHFLPLHPTAPHCTTLHPTATTVRHCLMADENV